MRLRSFESSIASRFKVSPKIRTDATFDFCNSIRQNQTLGFLVFPGLFRFLLVSLGGATYPNLSHGAKLEAP